MRDFEEIKIRGKSSNRTRVRRAASENDYDCVFEKDEQSGLYFAFINSNYNLQSPRELVVEHISKFDSSNPESSMRQIIKEVDDAFINRGYISRCLVLLYLTDDEAYFAKAGGGLDLYFIPPPAIDDFEPLIFSISSRSWEAERDFYVGSGAAIPMIESVGGFGLVVVVTNSMKTNIEERYEMEIKACLSHEFEIGVNKKNRGLVCDRFFDLVYNKSNIHHIDAYMAIV